MPVLSDITKLGQPPALLGVFLSVGALSVIIHLILQNPKLLGRLSNLFAAPKATKARKLPSADYEDVFPPAPAGFKTADLTKLPKAKVLKFDEDYRKADPSSYVFTGFRVSDIKKLGDFPDYSALSGVPLPKPLEDFDIDKATPRPYRPFRWTYHQTMSLTKMEPDFWVELESTYRKRMAQRLELYKQHGSDVLQARPGSELACKELMEMVVQFICARYPKQFEMKGKKTLVNHILGTETDLKNTEPLVVLLENVPEDFCIALREPTTGRYIFQAGLACSSVGWNVGSKIGLGLPAIHKTVPDYKEKMEFSMDRFFTKMPTNSPIQRGSWGIEVGQPLYLREDDPKFALRESQDPNLKLEDLHLRVDWQTLRRLPMSGGIVFGFKALFTPITEFENEPYIPSLVLKIFNDAKENLLKYKASMHTEHVVKPTMEKYIKAQIEKGLIEKDWEHHTLSEAPFFKGWEKKWRLK